MNISEQELLSLSIAQLAQISRNDTVGVLISSVKSETVQIDPDDFNIFMQSEFEENQMVFSIEDMKVSSDDGFDGLTSLTPVILLKGQPEFLFKVAASSGLRFVSAIMGDEYFGNVSSIWEVGAVVENDVPLMGEELFMFNIFRRACSRGISEGCNIHIGITAGWGMDNYIGDLDKFKESDIFKAGRLVWQRTPLG